MTVGRRGGVSLIAERRRVAIAEGSADYAAKRARLLQVAATVFREKGYAAATLGDIAAAFGTDRASLYYYVASKEDLFQAALSDILLANLERAEEIAARDLPVREKITDLVRVILHSHSVDHPYMQMYIQEDMRRVAFQDAEWAVTMVQRTSRLESLFIRSLAEGVQTGQLRQGISPVLMANGIFGMMMWTHRWWTPGQKYPEDQVIAAFADIFLDGVAVPVDGEATSQRSS